jgi:hypothetical protein
VGGTSILVQPTDITRTQYTKCRLWSASWRWANNARNMYRPLILNKLNRKCITLVSLYSYTVMHGQQNISLYWYTMIHGQQNIKPSSYFYQTLSKTLLKLMSPIRYLLPQLKSHMPEAILCVGTSMYGRVFKSKPCLLWGTCCKKLMLIEFLRLAVNLTPSLKSQAIPQTTTHRLPAKAERSYEEKCSDLKVC